MINEKLLITFRDIIKTIFDFIIIVVVISILISIFFRDHFKKLKELRDSENVIIMNQTKEILEDIYNISIDIKTSKRDRYRVLIGGPKKTYGNFIYDIYTTESHDKFLIYWELTDDIPEIKRIEKYASKEIVYEFKGLR